MFRDRISELSMDFAIRIVQLSQKLENEREFILSRQIRKSGTSIGANVRESKYAQSKADFISKLQIALKEAGETDFWLELLFRTSYISEADYSELSGLCKQMIAMLTASVRTSIENNK